MASIDGKIYFVCAVEFSGSPTEQDKAGCDGLYIKSIVPYLIDTPSWLELAKQFIQKKVGVSDE